MKKTKLKLRKWVKVTLAILLTIIAALILIILIMEGAKDFENLAKQCDKDRGYTCSYYDIRQYSLGK